MIIEVEGGQVELVVLFHIGERAREKAPQGD